MSNFLRRIFSDGSAELRNKVIGIYVVLIVANVGIWAWALVAFQNHPLLLGAAFSPIALACATRLTPTTSRQLTMSHAN